MPDDKRDRLREELEKRERASEERYFSDLSKKQLEKLRTTTRSAAEAAGQGKCPRCGAPLEIVQERGVAVDACPKQHGIWVDSHELDMIAKREGNSWLSRLLLGSRG